MAKVAARTTRVWVDEHALAASLSAIDLTPAKQELVKVDTFAATGPERLVGNHDHTQAYTGFFDGAEGAFDELAFVNLRTDEDHYVLTALSSAAEGGKGYERVVRFTEQPRSAQNGQAILLNLSDEGSGQICRATILRSAAIAGTGDGTGQNLGATSAGQVTVVTYRILAVDGAGSITLQVHESQDDGATDAYANVAALASGALTAVGVTRVTTTGATEAWKRVTISAYSGFTSVTVLVTIGVVPNTP